ncbi:uncharacterized protein ARMOST_17596 [Armillaria ostoyae]|uniref:Integrase catalytic domain-containing protein n=1 Tax=Armillaria ostoyae TaxID=47428 RepID=A0A284RZF3_ARMOS|nr:uncharacterized protein ARMOST_17596 [Armillaria ostoyae]
MTTSSHQVLPIKLDDDEKFNGENWATFEMVMMTEGNTRGLVNYWENKVAIPGATLAPLPATPINSLTPNLLEYAQRESVALASIIRNVKDVFGVGIDPHKPSHMAWEILKSDYGAYSDLIRNRREKTLKAVKYQDGEKVSGDGGYIERMRKLRKEANDAGAGIDDKSFKTTLLDSFPETWDPVVSTLYAEKNLTVVIARLIAHGERVVGRNSVSSPSSTQESTVQALQASIQALTLQVQSLSSKKSVAPRSDKSHTANENCKGLGHTLDECWKLGGGRQGQYPPWWKGKRDAPVPSSANLATASSSEAGSVYTNVTALSAIIDDETLKSIERALEAEKSAMMVNNASQGLVDTSLLYGDSGASTHFIQNKDCFFHYMPLGETTGTSSKAGAALNIQGIGTVALKSTVSGIQNVFTLSKALHCPDVSTNLISISRLDKEGWFVTFGGGQATFVDQKGTPQFTATLVNDLYAINGTLLRSEEYTALAARSLEAAVPIETWHMRFAHLGVDRITELEKRTLVDGLNIAKAERAGGKCEPCILGNQKRRPFDADVVPEKVALARVMVDIWGPARVQSIGGAKYALVFADDATSRRTPYYISDRRAETTIKALDQFTVMAERQTGKKLKKIRCDNEFRSDLWEMWGIEKGVIFEFTAPYSSAANGMAERTFGIVFGTVRILLLEAKMSDGWWAEACDYAIKAGNLLPSSRHPGKVPEEEWSGKRQTVSHLRVWGSTCYAKIPAAKGHSKLSPRGQKGRFVGLAGHGSYRILLDGVPGNKVIISRDVIFEELSPTRTVSLREGEIAYEDLIEPLTETIENHSQPPIDPPSPDRDQPVQLPTAPIQAPPTQPRVNPLPAKRPSRIPKPTRALLESKEYAKREEEAKRKGNNWANDNTVPLLADEDDVEDIVALKASEISNIVDRHDMWVPDDYHQAMTKAKIWRPAMDAEIRRMEERDVWRVVPREPWMQVIDTRWTFDKKLDGDTAELLKRRARLVVKGFTQIKGLHYYDSFAAVVRYESLRMFFAVVAAHGLDFWLIDFVGAYLNAEPQGENYVSLPQGYEDIVTRDYPKGEYVLQMLRAMYGTMDAGNAWFHELNNTLTAQGHKQSRADPCVRLLKNGSERTYTCTYTDDVSGASTSTEEGKRVRKEIGSVYEIKDLGKHNSVLGMTVEFDEETGAISLHQKNLILKTLENFGMSDCKPKATPLPVGSLMNLDTQPQPIPNADKEFMGDKDYRGVLGSLNHIANGTRPDIAFATNYLQRYASDARPIHWSRAMHVLAYLKGTIEYRITYHRGNAEDDGLTPVGYVDSSHGDDRTSGKSTMGYVFTMAGGPVAWSSRSQKRVALSTSEAEYVATVHGGRQSLWMGSFLDEIELSKDRPYPLNCDNNSAINLTQNTKGHGKSKHFAMDYHWIRDSVQLGELDVRYIPSEDNLADLFTKSVPKPRATELLKRMGMTRV